MNCDKLSLYSKLTAIRTDTSLRSAVGGGYNFCRLTLGKEVNLI